jgi:hypothetical protein
VGVTTPHAPAAALVHQASAPVTLGPVTRERAARVLEQALATVWAAVLESHGHDPASGWEVQVGTLVLRPVAPPAPGPPAGAPTPAAGNGLPP